MSRVPHPNVEERVARGRAAREHTARESHAGWVPAAGRRDPVALLEEQNVTREADLVPVRHGRMMVSPFTFYRGAAKIMAADLADTPNAGLDSPALRRRAPLELRLVRLAGAHAALRTERLRRDAARAVRVRREAHGRELHDRGAQQRFHRGRHDRRDARVGDRLPRDDGRVRGAAGVGDLVRAHVGGRPARARPRRLARATKSKADKTAREGRRRRGCESPHPRQRAGAVEARRVRRRSVPDRQPAAAHRPRARCWATTYGLSADDVSNAIHDQFVGVPRHAAGRSASPAGAVRGRRRGPQGRRRRQRGHACVHRPAPGPRSAGSRSSCRSKKRAPRYWRTTCRRAGTRSPASASCRASD